MDQVENNQPLKWLPLEVERANRVLGSIAVHVGQATVEMKLRFDPQLLEEDIIHETEGGTTQGGIISPILANLYLYYVLDLWFDRVVKPRCRGEAYMVRMLTALYVASSTKMMQIGSTPRHRIGWANSILVLLPRS